jgi:hypothetical protein
MRRCALLWLAGLALVVGALFLTDELLWQPSLTQDNVRRIRPGMTLAEVGSLLGGPATSEMDMRDEQAAVAKGYRWLRHWQAKCALVAVQFFPDGRVMAVGGHGRPQPGPLARLRSWLGW